MSRRRTRDVWRLEVNYGHGHGWEYEIAEHSRDAILARLREYRTNCIYPARVRKTRERILPPCLTSMGCLCAGHARGSHPLDMCDTNE